MRLVLIVLGFYGFFHVASTIVVMVRIRLRQRCVTPPGPPLVSLLRPVRGLENHLEAALRSSFELSYPRVEIIFCVDDADDPVVPLVRRLIADYPDKNAQLLIGRDRLGGNPKVDNLAKGWRVAAGEYVIFSDSNVLLPAEFIESLFARWRPGVGLVSTTAVMTEPVGFAAEIECAFINTYMMRWLLWGDAIGLGFAYGKTLMWRRSDLQQLGGIAALATDAADEIAAGKAARRTLRLRQRLAQRPVQQVIGRRSFSFIWRRQVRWARLRRAGYPGIFAAEVGVWAAVPFAAGLVGAAAGSVSWWLVAAYVAAWYALEAMLALGARLPFSATMPLAWVFRDLVVVPVTWVLGWTGKSIEWRGASLSVAKPSGAGLPTGERRGR